MSIPRNRRKIVRQILTRVLDRGGTRQEAVRAALDAGCGWDAIHRELLVLEKRGRCEPRRVLPIQRAIHA